MTGIHILLWGFRAVQKVGGHGQLLEPSSVDGVIGRDFSSYSTVKHFKQITSNHKGFFGE